MLFRSFVGFFAVFSQSLILSIFDSYFMLPMCVVIFTFAFSAGRISRFLSQRTFVLLGEISFSFYMIHAPIIWWMDHHRLPFFKAHQGWSTLGALSLTMLASFLCYHFYEMPMRGWIKERLH